MEQVDKKEWNGNALKEEEKKKEKEKKKGIDEKEDVVTQQLNNSSHRFIDYDSKRFVLYQFVFCSFLKKQLLINDNKKMSFFFFLNEKRYRQQQQRSTLHIEDATSCSRLHVSSCSSCFEYILQLRHVGLKKRAQWGKEKNNKSARIVINHIVNIFTSVDFLLN